jgi:hypothetical protein
MRWCGWAFLAMFGCQSLWQPSPDQVVEAYFRAASEGREQDVRAHVSRACQGRPIARGAPAKVFWAPVSFTRLDVATLSNDGQRARVAYEYEGTASGKQVDEEVQVLGTKVDVKLDGVDVGSVSRTGTLDLILEDGVWKVGC